MFPKREVICADSLKWLQGKHFNAIITSLPDLNELGFNLLAYEDWLANVSVALMEVLQDDGCIIFYQTNKKHHGALVDKDYLISRQFYQRGYRKVFQRIVLRKPPGTIDLYRPGYSNMFCFSKKVTVGKTVPDVIYAGEMLAPNAIGMNACRMAIDFVTRQVGPQVILDPFCGAGTVLAVANQMGVDAIGIDIDPEQVAKARGVNLLAE